METITWKNSDLSGLNWEFENNSFRIGKMMILSGLGFNAKFITDKSIFHFKRVGFWDDKILIIKDRKYVGEIENKILGTTHIKLDTGQIFKVSSNLFNRNLKCVNLKGQTIIKYKMATLSSMRKGYIEISKSLTDDEREILSASGLIAGHFKTWRLIFFIMLIGLIFYLTSKFIA